MDTTAIDRTQPGEIELGTLNVRLAASRDEVDAAQALRFKVFYEEMTARPTPEMAARRRDFDRYDAVCDHLLVLDKARGEGAVAVVGTYRLIRRPAATLAGDFYSAGEYDIAAVKAFPGEVLELGRSCVDPQYRTRATMQLLWRGIAAYVFHHRIELMFGCASFPGTEPAAHALPLAYLHHRHLAPPAIRPRALPGRYHPMDLLDAAGIDERAAMARMPPLIKGYLRLGGWVGDGAVIDPQFGTTDVCILVQTKAVTDKYYRHYERSVREGGA